MPEAGNVTAALHQALRENRWLLVLATLQTLAALALAQRYGGAGLSGTFLVILKTLAVMTPLFLLVFTLWALARIARQRPAVRPIPVLWREISGWARDLPRVTSGLVALLATLAFCNAFSSVKELIPQIAPFAWDSALAGIDRALHGGTDPYRLIAPLGELPHATLLLDLVYRLWFVVLYFVVFAACFADRNRTARNAFLIAFPLTWGLGGNALALLFSSAGPCFQAPLGLGDGFEPLMAHLRQVNETTPILALTIQDALWTGYAEGGGLHGISAFPSMHVASTTLLALYAFTWRRWAGWAMTGFLGLILLGSVHLGWHYAVDGYAGAALAGLFWACARRLALTDPPRALAPAPV